MFDQRLRSFYTYIQYVHVHVYAMANGFLPDAVFDASKRNEYKVFGQWENARESYAGLVIQSIV